MLYLGRVIIKTVFVWYICLQVKKNKAKIVQDSVLQACQPPVKCAANNGLIFLLFPYNKALLLSPVFLS